MPIAFDDIPQAKPAYELIDGRLYRKMSPMRRHARLQAAFLRVLQNWAGPEADVLAEWRCRISDRERRYALVPDVAYFSAQRLAQLDLEAREEPACGPDIAVEILSPGESRRLLNLKIPAYLRAGGTLVLIVDPESRTVDVHSAAGTRRFACGELLVAPQFPGLRIDLGELFRVLDRP